MTICAWMYDVAREQSPREEWLHDVLERSLSAGYDAVGFYLEHRFAYASAPWAAGPGCLTPDVVERLHARFRSQGLRLIPFLNTLGHMEGFIRAEGGRWMAEGPPGKMFNLQLCPTRPECQTFVRGLIDDVISVFDDEWLHLGGDEASQLGQCPACAQRAKTIGAAGIFAEHYAPLCRYALDRGRRPALWGDMLLSHPEALAALPRETIIFDWQYFDRPAESTRKFRDAGFDVVCCPSLQTYNSAWCFLKESQRNIDQHAADSRELGALGVCVTTWEFSGGSAYETVMPLIYAAGRRLSQAFEWDAALTQEGGEAYTRAADILGNQIPAASEFLKPGTWRQLRDRFMIRQNPFLLWRDWREEACGPVGDEILRLCDEADAARTAAGGLIRPRAAPGYTNHPLALPIELLRTAVLWVWGVEAASNHYAAGAIDACIAELESLRGLLERLRPGLRRAAEAGGSHADLHRLDRMQEKRQTAIDRLRSLQPGGGYRPGFQTIVQDAYLPGDQAAWLTDR